MGFTIRRDGEERFFGGKDVPDFLVKANTILLIIGRYEYRISTADSISIDTGAGLAQFTGTITELKEEIKPVFFHSASSTGVTSYNDLDDKPFTSAEVTSLKQILAINNTDQNNT